MWGKPSKSRCNLCTEPPLASSSQHLWCPEVVSALWWCKLFHHILRRCTLLLTIHNMHCRYIYIMAMINMNTYICIHIYHCHYIYVSAMHVVNCKKQCASAQYVVKKLTSPKSGHHLGTPQVLWRRRQGRLSAKITSALAWFSSHLRLENLQFATPCGVQSFRGVETRKLSLQLASIVYQDWAVWHLKRWFSDAIMSWETEPTF